PALFFKAAQCLPVSATGVKIPQLFYKDRVEYNDTFDLGVTALTGPAYYTIFNAHETAGITLLPRTTGTQYVDLTYYRRFPTLTLDSDTINAPQEWERAIELRAQYEMLVIHASDSPVLPLRRQDAAAAWQM